MTHDDGIRVLRGPHIWVDRRAPCEILVDGSVVGQLGPNQDMRFSVVPTARAGPCGQDTPRVARGETGIAPQTGLMLTRCWPHSCSLWPATSVGYTLSVRCGHENDLHLHYRLRRAYRGPSPSTAHHQRRNDYRRRWYVQRVVHPEARGCCSSPESPHAGRSRIAH
jgi:hypothetical protein